jgi:hypothetical protein
VRGLVLSGAFTVHQDDEPVTFAPGQIFVVDEGKLHDEWVGPEGAEVLIGRKLSKPRRS